MSEEKLEQEIVDGEPHEFDIIPVQDENTKVFAIQDFDVLFKRLEDWTKANNPKGKINSQEDFDYYLKDKPKGRPVTGQVVVLSKRAEAATIKELVEGGRKGIVKQTMGTFEDQAKRIEKLLGDFDKDCKEEKDKWLKATTNKVAKPTALSITVKTFDKKVIEKVKAYALKLGCEVK